MTVTIPSGISGVNYLWQDGSTNPDFTTTQSGVFILEVSNLCGTDTDTIAVDISGVPPVVDLGADTVLCEGVTLQLISSADAITTITWQDGSSLPTYLVSTAGTYILSETNRCGDATDSVVVDYLAAPMPFSLGRIPHFARGICSIGFTKYHFHDGMAGRQQSKHPAGRCCGHL